MNWIKMKSFVVGFGLLWCAVVFAGDRLILDMVHHNPGETTYDSAYNDPAVIKEMGYNGKVYFLFESPALAINWESVDSDILPKGSEERKWVDAKAEQIRQMHAACKAQDIKTYAMSDLILFPKRLIAKYGIEKTFGDPNHPQVEKLLRAQINEMFNQFPDFDGLVVRIGETYLEDAPFHQGHIENKTDPQKTIIPLLQILREEICVKRDKQLIFRTWRAFDNNESRYMAVSDAVEPHPNLVISIKHCEGDFFRTHPFSRCIGMGRHRQIIEVQCAREYEGKGAYPNYIANGVIEGFEEHADMPKDKINSLRSFYEKTPELFAGIWTWSRGGGWRGPYIKNEMWCDLNAWVTAQWALDPSKSEESVFNRYATERLKLKDGDVAKFRRLCLLSANSVLKGRYSEPGGMRVIWTRDQGIGWPGVISDAAKQQRSLQQKDEAIAQWQEIVSLAESIQWADEATREHAIASAYYGLHLYEIYRSKIYMADAEAKGDRDGIKKWLKAYDAAWATYDQLPEQYPSVASLYKQYKADENLKRLRAAVGVPAPPVLSIPRKPVSLDGALFKLTTADGMAAGKKTFTPSIVSVLSDKRVIGPADGAALKAGSTLDRLANSEWAGFSLEANNGNSLDNATEFSRGYLEFTIEALTGFALNCRELTFASARGGSSSTRGYVLFASVNGGAINFGDTPVSTVINETGTRDAPRKVSVDLSAATYQGIDCITFRYYPLTPSPGISMEFDGMALFGSIGERSAETVRTAKSQCLLTGRVMDTSDNRLPNARVSLRTIGAKTLTDPNGKFTLRFDR
ncbi:hypothetical protein SH580_06070 [Coraliomargarita algicola]|uniref:Uncharacterized protein n=1 Tax=Coraliomargarita algicola TaxID=3092156 RepID=A0ABZ0RP18_9BACT|nr:hypothetical protein [Coraliomargarita sp. J2-16]WPJ97272.1 hypothetical protein SH580_06070 [Coraliomargarita sp. J2-16]